ncbi:MAG TPA: FMN-binding protein [Thermoanaerobaculia bacterium]|nr:FMN-binding protein [Thermoanaerobaculia bacterium]
MIAPVAPRASAWPMLRAMVGVGAFCGLLIVGVYELTRPVIERKKAEALERAILEVVPAAASSASFRLTAEDRFEPASGPAGKETRVHAAYDAAGALVGFAVEARGQGYQDTIRVLWGYAPDRQAIVGLRVLESKETPGLGDRIESDPAFAENFRELDVSVDEAGTALAHPIVAVAHGTKSNPWEVDGITGATISSKAIGRILDESAEFWAPRLRRELATFERREAP